VDELRGTLLASGLQRASVLDVDQDHLLIERRGETDPNSWIKVREQYR
jgi:hypothetical protein